MELENAKQLWQQFDTSFDLRLDAARLQRSHLDNAQTSTKRLSRFLIVDAILNVLLVALVGAFIGDHFGQTRFLIPAVIFDVCAIASLAARVCAVVLLAGIHPDEPVVTIQRKLEGLRLLRIRTVRWTLLVAPLMWVPMLIIVLNWLFAVDAYATLGIAYLAANAIFGVLFLAACVFLARLYGERLGSSPIVKGIADSISGRSLHEAMRSWTAIARFETVSEMD
jgi:hypothetical protein